MKRRITKRSIGNIAKKNLTWAQAKVRYPKLNPYGDIDGDMIMNMLDCRPFDKKRQDEPAKKVKEGFFTKVKRVLRPEISYKQYAEAIQSTPSREVRKQLYKGYNKYQTEVAKEQAEKALLNPEYARYKEQQQIVKRAEIQNKLASGEKNLQRFQEQQAYAKTRTGRLGAAIGKTFEMARPGGITRVLYRKQIPITAQNIQQEYPTRPSQNLKGSSGGKVGRPRQSYDRRYAAYGGVYGYRKYMAAQYRERALQLKAQANISPQQQMVINRMQSQQMYAQQNPENKVISDTYGRTPEMEIMPEIDYWANIVG